MSWALPKNPYAIMATGLLSLQKRYAASADSPFRSSLLPRGYCSIACLRYLVFYDDCEFEWIAIAGPGPVERVQFHRDAPTFQMITELNMRVRYMQMVNWMSFVSLARYSEY